MPTQRPDKFVHLRLTPDTVRALGEIEKEIQADPFFGPMLRVHGSDRIPYTRLIQYAIGVAATRLREAA